MILRAFLFAVVAACFPLVAMAQDDAPDGRAVLAQQFIEQAHATDAFVIDIDPSVRAPRIRHVASGFVCLLSSQLTSSIIRATSDSASCYTAQPFIGLTHAAVRVAMETSLDDDLQQVVAMQQTAHRDLRSYDPPTASPSSPSETEQRSANLTDGRQFYYVRLTHVNGWSIRVIFATQMEFARSVEAQWAYVLQNLGSPSAERRH